MKKGYVKLLTLEFLLLIILLFNSFVYNILNYYTLSLVLFAFLAISYIMLGFEKEKNRYKKDTIINITIYSIVYLLITYISGIFLGFTRTGYSFAFFSVVGNVFPVLLSLIIIELLRYQITTKGEGSKIVYALMLIVFVFIDITLYMHQYNFASGDSIIKLICLRLLPSISKNIMLIYLTKKIGYTPSIIYRLIIELYIFIIPIAPDLGEYGSSILGIMFPAIVGLNIYNIFKNEKVAKKEEIRKIKREKKITNAMYISTIVILSVIAALTSGKFKYQAVTIGSGSMRPKIHVGDIIIIEKLNDTAKESIKNGEILVYKYANKIIVHRVIDKKKTGDSIYYYTKGDANDSDDGHPILLEDIIGVTKGKIPYVGYPSVWLNKQLKH